MVGVARSVAWKAMIIPRSHELDRGIISLGAVGIHGQPRPEVSRSVRPQRAVSSLNRLRAEALATLPLASMPVR
jgi:hypothetical protein